MPGVRDRWAEAAAYEDFMGRWSRALAPRFVSWIGAPAGLHWLDVGCGTGALAAALCERAAPASVTGCDPSAAFVEAARERSADPRASFVVAGTGGLPPRAGGYGGVASLLALNFFPDAPAALREMVALAAPRGFVAACVWDYAGGMALLRRFWDAVVALDPAVRPLDEGVRFPLCAPEALTALCDGAGLAHVRAAPLEIPTTFSSFEDYWRPMLGGTGPAPSYVATLDDRRRAALVDELERTLPAAADGTIALHARAWAVCGRVR